MEVNKPIEEWNQPQPPVQDNKKVACGVLAILLGPLGIHKFLLGYKNEGIITLVLSLVTCGTVTSIIGLIEGIIYLCMSDQAFYQTYQVGKKGWF
jgi:TM2 domain-containing membrane protein YozV